MPHQPVRTTSDFPIFIYNLLTYMGVSRTHLQKLPSGQILIRPTTGVPLTIYLVLHINAWCKGIYVITLLAGVWNFEMEFFDYIAALLWLLIFIEVCLGDLLLMRTHPFFEVITAGLVLQDEIQRKLGSKGEAFQEKQHSSTVKKVAFQWVIILLGISACILQYASAPKYCIFTNALIETDTALINWIMGLHDVGFIVSAWMLYGSNIAIQSVCGGQLQHCLRFMVHQVQLLSSKGVENIGQPRRRDVSKDMSVSVQVRPVGDGIAITRGIQPGCNYTIDELIIDYVKLRLYSDRLNECCSNNFLAVHVIAYIQMTCDVFVIFQLLRTPGSQPSDVAYFIEDCIVCTYLLYKCFKAISFVGEASDEFLQALKLYVIQSSPRRKYHRKVLKSFPRVVMKLGPSICGKKQQTVGNACMLLMNYYIMVALW